MLRLFLRLYLLLALGFAAAIFVVDHVIDAFYDSIVENYHRDAVRGQAYSLVEKLAPLDQAGRQRQLEDWRPHYGLELSLTDARQAKLTQEEQALLDKNLLVVREDFTEFISRIDAGPQLLDIKLPPEPSLTPLFTVLAYILLGVLVGIALLVWVRPHWRDLETLRLATQRFGDGDLSSRTRIFRRSDIRTLAQHFNQMADRIESLISNQRELTNAVSHELRTPISRLSFELEQLNKQVDAEVRHDLIEDMRADLGELEEMVSELLTYARLEHGNVGSHREIVDAASWLDSVVADVALEAEAAGVTCEISACQVEQIRIEPRFMARAVINLLRNAIRHAHSRVEIALLDQGDSCQIRVNDDGPGIPADARQKIFEPFSRLDDSRDRSTGGFGLGLAIVRRVAQWHGGYAEALETPQGGASFRLTWERPRCQRRLNNLSQIADKAVRIASQARPSMGHLAFPPGIPCFAPCTFPFSAACSAPAAATACHPPRQRRAPPWATTARSSTICNATSAGKWKGRTCPAWPWHWSTTSNWSGLAVSAMPTDSKGSTPASTPHSTPATCPSY